MNKSKLIRIARDYVEIPDDASQIEYDCYDDIYQLSFLNEVQMDISGASTQYFTTVTLTGNTLEIKGRATEPWEDTWSKTIEL